MIQTTVPALLAGLFTWGMTALGASLVFFFQSIQEKITNMMLGFASGVMIAASFWSLLAPAISMSEGLGFLSFLPALAGFLVGGGFIALTDRIVSRLERFEDSESHSCNMLLLAITIHNIPEGLAVGVAFGAATGGDDLALISAIGLAFGIGIQNFPEGAAVSIPLRAAGMSRRKSFWYGQLSAVVEPVFCVLGALLVTVITPILPFALSFAAGAMIFVVAQELIPRSQSGKGSSLASFGTMLGFAVMMMLDVMLG